MDKSWILKTMQMAFSCLICWYVYVKLMLPKYALQVCYEFKTLRDEQNG